MGRLFVAPVHQLCRYRRHATRADSLVSAQRGPSFGSDHDPMNAEQRPADGPHTPPPHPTWSPRTTLAAVGIAVALAVGGAGGGHAAAAGSSAVGRGPAGRRRLGRPHGPGPGPGIAAGTLHSHVASDGKRADSPPN